MTENHSAHDRCRMSRARQSGSIRILAAALRPVFSGVLQ
jgi:hypothetical protein